MLALGDSIFHGLVAAGSCQGCHGPDAKGATGIGANLTDTVWLHSDGSLEGIHNTVKSGVMEPKESSSIMLPMGGAPLNSEQLRAVVAYVYSLSHK
jgi:mono/diheme cytochrome c family protein